MEKDKNAVCNAILDMFLQHEFNVNDSLDCLANLLAYSISQIDNLEERKLEAFLLDIRKDVLERIEFKKKHAQ